MVDSGRRGPPVSHTQVLRPEDTCQVSMGTSASLHATVRNLGHCSYYPEYRYRGYDSSHLCTGTVIRFFKPSRVNFYPFGFASNGPCPAQSLVTRCMLRSVAFAATLDFQSPVTHMRSISGGMLCVVYRTSERFVSSKLHRNMRQSVL